MANPAVSDQNRDSSTGKFVPGNRAQLSHQLKRAPRSLLLECTTEDQVRDLIQTAFTKAETGDAIWAVWLLNRIVPPLRATSPRAEFDLNAEDPARAAKDILAAVGEGTISSDVAKDLISSIESLNNIVQISTMQEQIDEIRSILAQ